MNNMTGDPNQGIRPSIFGFDTYPTHITQPIDWSRIPVDPNTAPFAPPGPQTMSITYPQPPAELGSFSFCTTQTPHPAQFPFPTPNAPLLSSNHGFGFNPTPTMRCKRKTDSPPPVQSFKQHITEEKMAEHMSRLHINSETAGSSKETDTDKTRRLYMCEEMRKLQSDSILPHSILSRIQRPCTALVLWTPPPRLLLDTLDNGNNNEENIPDNNRMEGMDGNNMDLDNV